MSVHVIDSEQTPDTAGDGDVLLVRTGDDVKVGRVQAGSTEWLGTVAATTLPLDGSPEELEIAARGVESALVERGG